MDCEYKVTAKYRGKIEPQVMCYADFDKAMEVFNELVRNREVYFAALQQLDGYVLIREYKGK